MNRLDHKFFSRLLMILAILLPSLLVGAAPTGLLADFQKSPATGVRAEPRFTWIVPGCVCNSSSDPVQTSYKVGFVRSFHDPPTHTTRHWAPARLLIIILFPPPTTTFFPTTQDCGDRRCEAGVGLWHRRIQQLYLRYVRWAHACSRHCVRMDCNNNNRFCVWFE